MSALRSPHVLTVAAGYALGAALYSALPDEAPLARPMAAFLLPTAAAVTYTLLRGLCTRHPVGGANSPDTLAVYDAVMLRFMLFLIGVHATMLVGLVGLLRDRHWAARIVPALLGLAMIADRQPPATDATQPGHRHPHIAHALRPRTVGADTPDCRICGRGARHRGSRLGRCAAAAHGACDDPRRRARRGARHPGAPVLVQEARRWNPSVS